VIKLGMDTHEVVRRFEAERQALALMDHPGIAKVLDGGATATGGTATVGVGAGDCWHAAASKAATTIAVMARAGQRLDRGAGPERDPALGTDRDLVVAAPGRVPRSRVRTSTS